jgi:Caspase domain
MSPRIWLALLELGLLSVGVMCGQTIVCSPTACPLASSTHPLQVCPAETSDSSEVLHFDRCQRKIVVNFCVIRPSDRSPLVAYSYDLIRTSDSKTIQSKAIHGGNFEFPAGKPITEPVDVDDPGRYSVRLTVSDPEGNAASLTVGPVDVTFYTKTSAVIVGIARYANPGIRQLSFAAHDAESFEKLIIHVVDPTHLDVHTFKDATATMDGILTSLQRLREDRQFCESDQFIFYYSGHGFIDDSGDHYLGAYGLDPANLSQTGLFVPRLFDLIDKIGQNGGITRKLILLDSCFSGLSESSSQGTSFSSGKEVLVMNHKIAPAGTPIVEHPDNIQDIKKQLSHLDAEEATIGSAAEADVPAEEGAILLDADKPRHFYFADELDATVLQNAKGHGLYTYFLLGNIERQLLPTMHLDLVDDNESEFKSGGDCHISFKAAQDKALEDLRNMVSHDPILQKRGRIQEFSYINGKSHLKPWTCTQ